MPATGPGHPPRRVHPGVCGAKPRSPRPSRDLLHGSRSPRPLAWSPRLRTCFGRWPRCCPCRMFTATSPVRQDVLHIAFVIDPIATLNVAKDSTLAMIRAAQRRGWRISVLGPGDLALQHGRTVGWTRDLVLTREAVEDLDAADPHDYYRVGPEGRTALDDVDLVMMRKDPPFDMEYVYATYLLERARDAGARVVNDPVSLRDCNEKFYATGFRDCTPPLVVAARQDVLLDFHAEHGDVV
ncbi:MAG: hypothetical protein F4089_00550, partial [Gammaproteobacteria bacterium]|nr:hypothetical protein [Gammaproteobacteria bacterium]